MFAASCLHDSPLAHQPLILWLSSYQKALSPLAVAVNPKWLCEVPDYQGLTTFYSNYYLLKGEKSPFSCSVYHFLGHGIDRTCSLSSFTGPNGVSLHFI